MRVVAASIVVMGLFGCDPLPPQAPYRTPKPEQSTRLNAPPREMRARTPESVTFYRAKTPDAAFVEVYTVTESGEDETEALAKMKLSAAGLGCDGLIVSAPQTKAVATRPGFYRPTVETVEVAVSGTCIMFEEDPGTWQAGPVDACVAGRQRILAAEDPDERARLARSVPPECHR